MKTLKQFLHEDAPPGEKYEDWIKANKKRFVAKYGEKDGMERLYGKAWNMYKANESKKEPAYIQDYINRYKDVYIKRHGDVEGMKRVRAQAWKQYQKDKTDMALATA